MSLVSLFLLYFRRFWQSMGLALIFVSLCRPFHTGLYVVHKMINTKQSSTQVQLQHMNVG